MEVKPALVFWVCLDILLLIGCVFVVNYWFNTTEKLKDPCGVCVKKISPELGECIYSPSNSWALEINLSELGYIPSPPLG